MENIGKFLDEASRLGVPKHDLFQTVDLFEEKNIPRVIDSIYAFARHAASLGRDVPLIGPKLAEKQPVCVFSFWHTNREVVLNRHRHWTYLLKRSLKVRRLFLCSMVSIRASTSPGWSLVESVRSTIRSGRSASLCHVLVIVMIFDRIVQVLLFPQCKPMDILKAPTNLEWSSAESGKLTIKSGMCSMYRSVISLAYSYVQSRSLDSFYADPRLHGRRKSVWNVIRR